MAAVKLTWERPELIVLARSQAEESVLSVCKYSGSVFPQTRVGRIYNCYIDKRQATPCSVINSS